METTAPPLFWAQKVTMLETIVKKIKGAFSHKKPADQLTAAFYRREYLFFKGINITRPPSFLVPLASVPAPIIKKQ